MRIDIMTLFPDTVNAVLHESIIGRAAKKGIIEINCYQIRDYTENKQMQVDDYPYGGGFGCVMMAQPLKSCLEHIQSQTAGMRSRVIYMSPQGKTYNQETAKRLKQDYDHLVLVCGHYEGIDERFIESCVDEEISLGDFVMTGGEIAAMAVADSVCRMIPGVLADEACYTGESHWDGLLEYPQYTRPEVWEGRAVPDVLLQGDHAKVEHWRRCRQLERTMVKRPDMFEKLTMNADDAQLMKEVMKQRSCRKLTGRITFRKAAEDDLPQILSTLDSAFSYLKRQRSSQWKTEKPNQFYILQSIKQESCRMAYDGDEYLGSFILSDTPKEEYNSITDGKWCDDSPYTVLEMLILSPEYHGSGAALCMLREAESLTRELGIKRIRTDVERKNKAMKTDLTDLGYRYRGNLARNPEEIHQCYEKILKETNA